MEGLAVHGSPWLAGLLAVLYWYTFVEAEVLRHYEPTGKRWPMLRERKKSQDTIPASTHFYAVTAIILTLTVAIMHFRPNVNWIVFTVMVLIIFMFFAFWFGPMLTKVPTHEGVVLMMADINFMLYLTVHKWSSLSLAVQTATFYWVVIFLVVYAAIPVIRRLRHRA